MEESLDDINIRKFMIKHKQVREQVILAYDEQLYALNKQLDEIEKRIKRSKKFDLNLINLQIKLTKKVTRVHMEKFKVEMQPTLDPKLNKIIMKMWSEKEEFGI